jgi:hypothetical protein
VSVQSLQSELSYHLQPLVIMVEAIKAASKDRMHIKSLTARANDDENNEATEWLINEDIRVRESVVMLVKLIRLSLQAARASKDSADKWLEQYRAKQAESVAP